jgi:hypothetical protein
MILLGEVEGTSWSFVGSINFAKLGILAQLVVHFPTKGLGKSDGRLTTCICCMVSTINLFNFFSTS